jgi:uncharacterized repeat protein (TIGR03806 family)
VATNGASDTTEGVRVRETPSGTRRAESSYMGRSAGRVVATLAAFCGASIFSCGSDDRSSGGASTPLSDAATPDVETPTGYRAYPPAEETTGGEVPASPRPRREFPLATPSIGGFKLVDAFPGNGLSCPSALVWTKGAEVFALERVGTVTDLGGAPREVLDFSDAVAMKGEGGALGLAVHPKFAEKPYAYVWYNAKGSKQRLSRFTWSPATKTFDRASEKILVEQEEQHTEHNGGRIAFGPDGFLYFGDGDDINEANHQRLDRALFAGIFRIDVDETGGAISHPPPRSPADGRSSGYFIPNDNPFVGVRGALEEYWALGLRNPFSFSFDRATGDLWAGDVGDTWREEINLIAKGGNYEWPIREGELVRSNAALAIGTAQPPRYSYAHSSMADLTAIFGGFVYRGKQLPELTGKYVYSDWPSCRIWAIAGGKRTTLIDSEWRRTPLGLAEDKDGELYVLHIGGVAKLARDSSAVDLPKRLSETTLFADVAGLVPASNLVPYDIRSPLWSDGAVKQRFIRVPNGAHVELGDGGVMKFPAGTILVKHFELPPSVVPSRRTRRLETRVLVHGTDTAYGVSYRWNAQGTDAELVAEPTDDVIQDTASGKTRTWHSPSFGECWACHRSENRVLGFTGRQIDLSKSKLVERGVLDPGVIAKLPPPLARPSDPAATLEARATAYLAANCSSCHHAGASFLGGGETWNASPNVPLASRGLVNTPHHNYPMARALGLVTAPLIAPGNPDRSLLLARIKSTDPDLRMPPLGRSLVDPDGAALIEQWIRSLGP